MTSHCYLGGFVGELAPLSDWLQDKLDHWATAVNALASVAPAYPQAAYTGLQKSLQQEWQFVQCVTRDIGPQFTDVAAAISQKFLPALFGASLEATDPRCALAGLPVKHAGLALPSPVATAEWNYKASTLAVSHLFAALRGRVEFHTLDHQSVILAVRLALTARRNERHDQALAAIVSQIPCCDTRRTLFRGKLTGQWLSVVPSAVNGTELSAEEF